MALFMLKNLLLLTINHGRHISQQKLINLTITNNGGHTLCNLSFPHITRDVDSNDVLSFAVAGVLISANRFTFNSIKQDHQSPQVQY